MSDSDNDVIDAGGGELVMGEAAFGTTAATQRTVCGWRWRFETAVRVSRDTGETAVGDLSMR
eukprot:6985047-Prymnesium_polylepis.1